MCLHADPTLTEEVANGSWPRKVYKILRYDQQCNVLNSPYNDFEWHQGVNISSRSRAIEIGNLEEQQDGATINHGFHCWLDRTHPDTHHEEENGEIVVELTGYKEDFVAAGDDNNEGFKSAVFAKVEIAEEEFKRVMSIGPTLEMYEDDDDDWDDEEDDDWDDDDDDDDDDDYDNDDDEEDWEEDDE